MSSDSSDDENLELLKEAANNDFISNDMFKENKECNLNKTKVEKLPSLRQKLEDDYYNILQITPECQTYISKQLSKFLDGILSYKTSNSDDEKINKKIKSRIKLFNDSKHYIKTEKPSQEIINKRKYEDVSSDNEEKCKSVVVSGDDILSKKDIKNWSNRSKAKIFHYKKNDQGKLIIIEPEFK